MAANSTYSQVDTAWVTAYIGLGANLGDARDTLLSAAEQLAHTDGIDKLKLSLLYRTAPIDSSGPDYINAVASLQTRLNPHELLDALQGIEQRHGRERPYRNAPRTLDLDLLLYSDMHIDTPRLTVPHPRMHLRAFVLQPLRDLAPGLQLEGESLSDLLKKCAGQDLEALR